MTHKGGGGSRKVVGALGLAGTGRSVGGELPPLPVALPELRRGLVDASVHGTTEKKAGEDAVMMGKMVSAEKREGRGWHGPAMLGSDLGLRHARPSLNTAAAAACSPFWRCGRASGVREKWWRGVEKRGGAGWFL